MTLQCWRCRALIETDKRQVVTHLPFNTLCESCHSWQHACINCLHYQPGKPNDCAMPGTEHVADREGRNTCDTFSLKQVSDSKPTTSLSDAEKKLFGRSESKPSSSFDDLFKS